jgi:hypothetical protein
VQKRLVDTNVIPRVLVEDPESLVDTFRGVFSLFPKIEAGEVSVFLLDLVVFKAFFVLRSTYRVPQQVAEILSFDSDLTNLGVCICTP